MAFKVALAEISLTMKLVVIQGACNLNLLTAKDTGVTARARDRGSQAFYKFISKVC
jgi:hypothetical protein